MNPQVQLTPRDRAILERWLKLQAARKSLKEWCVQARGFTPARHHELLIRKLEEVSATGGKRVIVCMPPGSGKSHYISVCFPPWYLAQRPGLSILACSHSKDLIQAFGRVARNLAEQYSDLLGYKLASWSKAADEWETSNGGRYFCAGTGGGIAGHRADLACLDDPIGKDEDANSQEFRDKLWRWFWNDFMPRLKPNGSVIIVANRRHEDDLVGRLIANYPDEWELIKLPLVIETPEQEASDPLGRKIGDILWPEWFNDRTLSDARRSPDFYGLYQQEPAPPGGELIQESWLQTYTPGELPSNLRYYVGSDHALGKRETNDFTCIVPAGLDEAGNLWILPDIIWKRLDAGEIVEAMIQVASRWKPVQWFAEDEHISRSIGPFLQKRMQETGVFFPLSPLRSVKDLVARSASIRGRMASGKVFFPAFASWWGRARHELLSFPLGKHDDFVSALSELGMGLSSMVRTTAPKPERDDRVIPPTVFDWNWLKRVKRQHASGRRF